MLNFWFGEKIQALIRETGKVIRVCEGRLYRVITPSRQALVHMEINPIELWHRRYGHMHYKIIPSLSKMVKGIPNIKEDREGVCNGCALGNNTRKLFTSSNTRSKKILVLIHPNVCGPMSNKSLGGHLYYVIVGASVLSFCGKTRQEWRGRPVELRILNEVPLACPTLLCTILTQSLRQPL